MPKAKAKKKSVKPKSTTLIQRLPKTKKEHLQLLLKFTERAITGGPNDHMVGQAARIRAEIKALR